jgi:NAD(P)H-flavin reductase
MYKLLDIRMIVPNIHILTVEAPDIAQSVQPGQFVIVRAEENGERIPLSVTDWDCDKGTVTLIVVNVGYTTNRLSKLKNGMFLPTVAGPLGNPLEIEKFGSVLCLGGCYGVGSIYPIARAMKEKGNRVVIALEAKSAFFFYWEDKLKHVCDDILYITRDGSKGYCGHVDKLTDILQTITPSIDRIIINGCNHLLREGSDSSRSLGIKTLVCLNTLMIDGTGMCGVCRVSVGGATKFACVDGPYFDGHQVNWDELFKRRQSYLREEVVSLSSSDCE